MNQSEAMAAFGVKSRKIWSRWVNDGLPRRQRPHSNGYEYDLDEIKAWLDSRQTALTDAQDFDAMLLEERARKTAAERELRELKLAEERGELVRAADVNRTWGEAAVRIRACLMRLPAECAAEVYGCASEREVEERLLAAVRAALEELADGRFPVAAAPTA